jgi:hypothetical protein
MALSGFRAALSRALPAPSPLRPLRAGELRAGEPLPVDLYDAAGRPMLREGATIADELTLGRLLERGARVDGERLDALRAAVAEAPPILLPRVTKVRPWIRVHALRDALEPALAALAAGGPDVPGALHAVRDAAAELQRLGALDPDAMLAVPLLLEGGGYGTRHAIGTAVIADALLARLGASAPRRRSAVLAALTMNVGMLELQERLWAHAGHLDAAQRHEVLGHPEHGVALLRAAGVDDPLWLAAVVQHHEHADGTGYPARLAADVLSIEAQALMVADRWCAWVAPRAYRPGAPPDAALRLLHGKLAAECVAPLADALVDVVGPTPPGTAVRLASGELGLVFRRGRDPRAPLVLAFRSAIGAVHADGVRRATTEPRLRIEGCIPIRELGVPVDPARIWEAAEILEPEAVPAA